jgi:Icc-related predicted phosphoesterase
MKNLNERVLFTSDLHGGGYESLFNYADRRQIDSVILGGDLCPNGDSDFHRIEYQREFLRNHFKNIIKEFKKNNPNREVYLITGNNDCASNIEILEEGHDKGIWKFINNKNIQFGETNYRIAGYPYLPISPFTLADWYKFDVRELSLDRESKIFDKNFSAITVGKITTGGKWSNRNFLEDSPGFIEDDLQKNLFTKNIENLFLISHCPALGYFDSVPPAGKSIGSEAILRFSRGEYSEGKKPKAVLTGHTHHFSLCYSKQFKQEVDNTQFIYSANGPDLMNQNNHISVILFNIHEVEKAIRREIKID